MNILHYYWTQFNDEKRTGGGAQIYLKNIINEQKKHNKIYILSSGLDYDSKGKCYIKQLIKKENVEQFSIVNSPIKAPGGKSFYNIDKYILDTEVKMILKNFINSIGNIDIIHFHSLEGLSIGVLTLKRDFPNIKFFITLHNYYLFCAGVNLWKNDSEVCLDFNSGKDCLTCLGKRKDKIKSFLFKRKNIAYYREFREKNIYYVNKYFDKIICVSERVKEIAKNMGILENKLIVSYIGTEFANNQENKLKYDVKDNILNIIYMGYMRKDKGFFFFLDALNKLDVETSKRITVSIAAKINNKKVKEKLYELKRFFKDIIIYEHGYNHENIDAILNNINLGIVPVLWEDNLPQVAIELKSKGIAVLASSRGGAKELTNNKNFEFEAGNIKDFNKKIVNIVKNQNYLNEYFTDGIKLYTIKEHCRELELIYMN